MEIDIRDGNIVQVTSGGRKIEVVCKDDEQAERISLELVCKRMNGDI